MDIDIVSISIFFYNSKLKILTECKDITPFDEQGKEHCEHVAYNMELYKRGGKLYINPRFINK